MKKKRMINHVLLTFKKDARPRSKKPLWEYTKVETCVVGDNIADIIKWNKHVISRYKGELSNVKIITPMSLTSYEL